MSLEKISALGVYRAKDLVCGFERSCLIDHLGANAGPLWDSLSSLVELEQKMRVSGPPTKNETHSTKLVTAYVTPTTSVQRVEPEGRLRSTDEERKMAENNADVIIELIRTQYKDIKKFMTLAEPGSQLSLKLLQGLQQVLSTFSHATLANAIRSWKRWDKWGLEQSPRCPPTMANPLLIALFAKDICDGAESKRRNAGGRSAAMGVLNGLLFLQTHAAIPIGIDMKICTLFLKEERKLVSGKQALPLTPSELWRLEAWAVSDDKIKSLIASAACVIGTSCLRFRHAQRSKPVSLQDGLWMSVCSQDKVRKHNQRGQPYEWVAYEKHIWHDDIMQRYRQKMHELGFSNLEFMMPKFQPNRSSMETARTFEAKPMTTATFQKCLRQLITSAPDLGSCVGTCSKTTYSLRRLMPTLAELEGLSMEQRFALGNWKHNSATVGACSPDAMPFLYVDRGTKLTKQLEAKSKIVDSLIKALRHEKHEDIAHWNWHTSPLRERLGIKNNKNEEQFDNSSSSSSSESEDECEIWAIEWILSRSGGKTHRRHQFDPLKTKCGMVVKPPVEFGFDARKVRDKFGMVTWCSRCAADVRDALALS